MSIAATVGIPVITGVPACIHDGFVALENVKADQTFLLYLLKASEPRLREAGQSGSQMNVNSDIVRGLEIQVPRRVEEQRRIATALWDADDLIASLQRLLAKKRAIKQGLMQELLTGRTRLHGFNHEWAPVTLGAVGTTYGGLVGKSGKDFGHGRGRFVTFVEVMRDARLRGVELARVDVKRSERQNEVRLGDVLFNGSSETPDEVALAAAVEFDEPGVLLNSFCFGYRLSRFDVIDPLFLAYFFRATPGRDLIVSLAQGSTRYNIAKTKLVRTVIVLPKIAEQQAIAAVLRGADTEIEALERLLDATRAIKQGMMQELLTGRTRLLPSEASV